MHPDDRVPVWFMRQAGRSLPEYRASREGIGMLESCMRPELVAEITLQPVRRYGVDAAFSTPTSCCRSRRQEWTWTSSLAAAR